MYVCYTFATVIVIIIVIILNPTSFNAGYRYVSYFTRKGKQ